jgi:hypothetical protein
LEKEKPAHDILCRDFGYRVTSTLRPPLTCSLAFYFAMGGVKAEVIWFENGRMYEKNQVNGEVTSSYIFGDDSPTLCSVEFSTGYP